jgi:hypothetical protein
MLLLSVLFLTFLSSSHSLANTLIHEKILSIHNGEEAEDALIFYSSGRVAHIPAAKKHLYSSQELDKHKKWKKITTSDISRSIPMTNGPYSPSILQSFEEAVRLLQETRSDYDEKSQCYNRAHVWAYEWRTEKNIFSSKVWLFFTPQYIRKYKFNWWFHVAPSVHVINKNAVKERIMDRKYAKSPLKLKEWTDIFMRDQSHCPVVDQYSHHADYPESGSCFVMKSSMYYYRPLDLEEIELKGKIKERWEAPEVIDAYLDGFNVVL